MRSLIAHYYLILGAILSVGCVFNPASAAVALAIVFSSKLAEKYLTRNISDSERADNNTLKAEVAKLKQKVEQIELGKAFRP